MTVIGAIRHRTTGASVLFSGILIACALWFSTLSHGAREARDDLVRLSDLAVAVHTLDALEWKARAMPGGIGEIREDLQAARGEIETLLSDLRRPRGNTDLLEFPERLFAAYRGAVDRELDLLVSGNLDAAAELDETTVDPAYHAIHEAIRTSSRELAVRAAGAELAATLGQILAIVAAALAIGILAWRIQENRRRAAVASTESQLHLDHRTRLEAEVEDRTHELLRTNAALREAKERAERADRAKGEFLANMSHELRTPLHAILSFAELGAQGAERREPERLVRYFQRISQGGHTLLELVNDLLDLAALENGEREYVFTEVDLPALITSECGWVLPMCGNRGIELISGDMSSSAVIEGDEENLHQVFRHVLENAVKFTRSRIEVSLGEEDDAIVVRIEDDGPGIPPGEHEAIFERFVQSSRTKTGAGGSGLGLSICREIVRGHGGRIWAEDAPGGGARFCVQLLRSVPKRAPGAVRSPGPRAA